MTAVAALGVVLVCALGVYGGMALACAWFPDFAWWRGACRQDRELLVAAVTGLSALLVTAVVLAEQRQRSRRR